MKPFWFVILINVVVLGYQITETFLGSSQAASFLLGCGLIYFSTLLNVWIFRVAKKSVAYLVLLVVFKLVLILGVLIILFSSEYLKSGFISGIITGAEIKWFVVGVVFSILMLSILAKNVLTNSAKHST